MTLKLNCSTCGAPIEWSDAYPYRPFCSARCRDRDLLGWANEQHRIAGEALVEDELFSEDLLRETQRRGARED